MAGKSKIDNIQALAVRAAYLHYIGGMKQAEVAKTLSIPSMKAHRLIGKAVADGLVKITIDADIADCLELETSLSKKYNLSICEIAPDLGENGLPLKTLAVAGSSYLKRTIELGEHKIIGIGHGRTLASATRYLPRMEKTDIRFVSLLGGLTRNFSANPHDVMHLIAEITNSPAYVMPVPFFANTTEDKEVLLSQKGVKEVFEMAESSTHKFVGIGTVDEDTQLVSTGMIERDELREIAKAGGVGELLGCFFDAKGNLIETPLTSRTLSIPLTANRNSQLIALAGGTKKIAAISAILESGWLSGLITDEQTAKSLLKGDS